MGYTDHLRYFYEYFTDILRIIVHTFLLFQHEYKSNSINGYFVLFLL